MDSTRYYVTAEGMAAAFADPNLETALEQVLRGEGSPALVKTLLARHLIGLERRERVQVDHNLLLLSGALTRLREVLPHNGEGRRAAPNPPVVVKDLRTEPRRLYKLRRTNVSEADLRALPRAARRVFFALQRSDVGTIKTLAADTGLNRRTVENATGALRKAGILADFDFKTR